MTQPVANYAKVLATAAVSAGTITVTANAQLGAGYTVPSGGFSSLVVNDATTIAGSNSGNQIASIPASDLGPNTIIEFGATSNGLVVSEVPSGIALNVAVPGAI